MMQVKVLYSEPTTYTSVGNSPFLTFDLIFPAARSFRCLVVFIDALKQTIILLLVQSSVQK
jgi:hypothetical protein